MTPFGSPLPRYRQELNSYFPDQVEKVWNSAVEDVSGKWCLASDVARLEAEHAELKVQLQALRAGIEQWVETIELTSTQARYQIVKDQLNVLSGALRALLAQTEET